MIPEDKRQSSLIIRKNRIKNINTKQEKTNKKRGKKLVGLENNSSTQLLLGIFFVLLMFDTYYFILHIIILILNNLT